MMSWEAYPIYSPIEAILAADFCIISTQIRVQRQPWLWGWILSTHGRLCPQGLWLTGFQQVCWEMFSISSNFQFLSFILLACIFHDLSIYTVLICCVVMIFLFDAHFSCTIPLGAALDFSRHPFRLTQSQNLQSSVSLGTGINGWTRNLPAESRTAIVTS